MMKTILFSEMTPDPAWEGEFNDWYDDEHIPLRMAVPGFRGAQRYKRNERDYLAVYDMDDPGVLASPEYGKVKNNPTEQTARMLRDVSVFTRYICKPLSVVQNVADEEFLAAPVLYPVFFTVPEDRLAAFDDWYEQDHVPILMEDKSWLAVRRFDIVTADPQPFNRLALHYLASHEVLDSPARAKARATDWRARLAAEDWFKGTYMVFDRHGDRFAPTWTGA